MAAPRCVSAGSKVTTLRSPRATQRYRKILPRVGTSAAVPLNDRPARSRRREGWLACWWERGVRGGAMDGWGCEVAGERERGGGGAGVERAA
ncbi:hypothetical protein BaRGS_00022037 [Batillaria attramentaria]|uniref:Uncharacterized protein n=1 Tax=Batillaria attramentaria TaxID=370345 RepID=A0ABD0KI55_9CAEN